MTNNNYEAKARIVRAGKSKVFQDWHEHAGVSMEEFLAGLRWLCEDPMPDGKPTRELGCIARADALWTEEQKEIIGSIEPNPNTGLYRLKRINFRDGRYGICYEDGRRWEHQADRATINATNRI